MGQECLYTVVVEGKRKGDQPEAVRSVRKALRIDLIGACSKKVVSFVTEEVPPIQQQYE